MKDLTNKTVEELRETIWTCGQSRLAFDELARRLEEAEQRSDAHDAEVAAKAMEEAAPAFRGAPDWLRKGYVEEVLISMAAEYRAKGRKE